MLRSAGLAFHLAGARPGPVDRLGVDHRQRWAKGAGSAPPAPGRLPAGAQHGGSGSAITSRPGSAPGRRSAAHQPTPPPGQAGSSLTWSVPGEQLFFSFPGDDHRRLQAVVEVCRHQVGGDMVGRRPLEQSRSSSDAIARSRCQDDGLFWYSLAVTAYATSRVVRVNSRGGGVKTSLAFQYASANKRGMLFD